MVESGKKLSVRKFTDSLGFPLALAAFAHSTGGFNATLEWGLAALTGLMAVVLLLENISSSARWKSFVEWVEDYDFGYVVFGLGLMTGGSTITGNPWGIILFMLAGAGFLAVGIGRLNGKQTAKVSARSPKVAIGVGVVVLVAGVTWMVVRWSEIVKDPLRGVDALQAYWLIGMGVIYGIAGLLTWRRRHLQVPVVEGKQLEVGAK